MGSGKDKSRSEDDLFNHETGEKNIGNCSGTTWKQGVAGGHYFLFDSFLGLEAFKGEITGPLSSENIINIFSNQREYPANLKMQDSIAQ